MNKIDDYYELTDRLSTILYALKWLNKNDNNIYYESIINQTEKLKKDFLVFGINNIGTPDE